MTGPDANLSTRGAAAARAGLFMTILLTKSPVIMESIKTFLSLGLAVM